jgi:hypothetical protein
MICIQMFQYPTSVVVIQYRGVLLRTGRRHLHNKAISCLLFWLFHAAVIWAADRPAVVLLMNWIKKRSPLNPGIVPTSAKGT